MAGTLNFAPGKTALKVKVPVIGDTFPEANEAFFVKLSSPSTNVRVADASGTGTIFSTD